MYAIEIFLSSSSVIMLAIAPCLLMLAIAPCLLMLGGLPQVHAMQYSLSGKATITQCPK